MTRPLAVLLALAAGCFGRVHPEWGTGLFLAACCAGWMASRVTGPRLLTLAALSVLAFAGAWTTDLRKPGELGKDSPLRFRATVAEDPVQGEAGPRLILDLEAVAEAEPAKWHPASGRVYLQVVGRPRPAAGRGDVALFSGRLRPPWGFRNPGSGGFEAYLARKGVGARASAAWPGSVCLVRPGPGAPAWLRWRRETAAAIGRAVPGQAGAVLAALVVGDGSGISRGTSESFRKAGTTHLIAISGLHLGILAMLLVPVLRRILVRVPGLALAKPVDPLARLFALPGLIAYAAVSGFQTSTLRALVMAGLVVAGGSLSRPTSPLGLLAAGSAALAVVRPRVLGDPGFQLSIAALAGLFWFAPRLESRMLWWRRPSDPLAPPPRRFARLAGGWTVGATRVLCAGVSATLATTPVVAFHFGSSSLLGLGLNPLAVPLVEFLCLPLGLGAALLRPLWSAAADLLWAVAGTGLDGLLRVQAFLVPHVPPLSSPALRFPVGVVGALGLLAAAGLALEGRHRLGKALTVAAAAALLIFLPLLAQRMRATFDPNAHLWALDVGQGQSLVLRLPGQAGPSWVVVDGGGFRDTGVDTGERIVVPALEALGARRLRLVVSTHPHPDHVLGLASVVRAGRPALLWIPSGFAGDVRYRELLQAARETGTRVQWVGPGGEALRLGSADMNARWTDGPEENDRSLVLRVSCAGRVALLPADVQRTGQAALLERGFSPRCDVLVAPHHGAANAAGEAFLRAARPSVVLISAGGRPGLPSEVFVAKAAGVGATVLSTFQSGCLHAVFGPEGVTAGAEDPRGVQDFEAASPLGERSEEAQNPPLDSTRRGQVGSTAKESSRSTRRKTHAFSENPG